MARFGRKNTDDTQTYGETVAEDYETYGNPLNYEDNGAPAEESAPSQSVASLATLDVEESDALPKRTRTTKDNPFAGHVARSLDTGKALKVTAPDANSAKEVEGMLRRAASNAGHGIDVRKVENGNGSVTVHFKANHSKRARAYTVDDVRSWASGRYTHDELYPRVAKHVSEAYREAHGHKVAKKK